MEVRSRSRVGDNDRNDDVSATIWVGNLPTDIQESEILQEYERYGKIKKVDLIGKVDQPDHQPYAFVHFWESRCANEALEATNQTPLFGQPFVKVTLRRPQGSAHSDDTRHRSKSDHDAQWRGQSGPDEKGEYRVLVENLPDDMGWQELKQLGAQFANRGVVTFARTHADCTGELEYTSYSDMKIAIQELDQRNFSGSTRRLRASQALPQQDKHAARKRQRSPSAPYRHERDRSSKQVKHDSSGKADDRTRIWIGGLPDDIKEDDLERVYKRFGKVLLVDIRKPRPGNCFAFVDYPSYSSGERAVEITAELPLFGMTPVKVGWPSRDRPEASAKSHNESRNADSAGRSDENAQIWIGGLPNRIEQEEIEHVYKKFGRIIEVDINRAREPAFAFVTFSRYTSAERAVQETNQQSLFGQRYIKVSWPTHKRQDDKDTNQAESSRCDAAGRQDDNARIWIGGLPKKVDEEEVRSIYKEFGRVVEVELVQSRGDLNFAYVTFSRYTSAERAIQDTNQESLFGQKYIKVAWPQS